MNLSMSAVTASFKGSSDDLLVIGQALQAAGIRVLGYAPAPNGSYNGWAAYALPGSFAAEKCITAITENIDDLNSLATWFARVEAIARDALRRG